MGEKRQRLTSLLAERVVIGDGAMATYLYQKGVPLGVCYEELAISAPHLLYQAHREYVEAGAQLLQTHTYAANLDGLSRYGLEGEAVAINRAAVQVARQAAGDEVYVAGTIGSISAGHVRTAQIERHRDLFKQQIEALLSEDVDALIFETFVDLDELLLALEVAKERTSLPLIAQIAQTEVGRTRDGRLLGDAFLSLQQAGADVVGLNCRYGPYDLLRTIEGMNVSSDLLLSIYPNAGRLQVSDGEYAYKSTPTYFKESAQKFWEQGVTLLGGCCGTTPAHIRAIADGVGGKARQIRPAAPAQRPQVRETISPKPSEIVPFPVGSSTSHGGPIRSTLVDKVKLRKTVIVELDPPRDLDVQKFLSGTAALEQAGADAVTMADNSLASTRMSNMALAAIMKQQFKIEPLVHVACRDRNLIGQQSHLMGLHALGIDQILVITGDPSKFGDLPGASSVFDTSSFDLIRMTKGLNEGVAFSGKPLKHRSRFVIGAAFNPNVRHWEKAIERLERKFEAGADFIMTQPIYDEETFIRLHESTRHLPIPIFVGIMPLTSIRNAEFLHNEVPGIRISPQALERMRKQTTPEGAKEEGVQMAKEWVDMAYPYFNGIYLITPFFHYDMTVQLTRYVREKEALTKELSQAPWASL